MAAHASARRVRVICAALVVFDGYRYTRRVYHGPPPHPMDATSLARFVDDLIWLHRRGYVLTTWGGTAGDFRVLHANVDRARQAALLGIVGQHVDLALVASSFVGHMPSLRATAHAMGVAKLPGASAAAPARWTAGHASAVVAHVDADASLTAQAYLVAMFNSQRACPWAEIPAHHAWLPWVSHHGVHRVWHAPPRDGRLPNVLECLEHARTCTFAWSAPRDPFSCTQWLIPRERAAEATDEA